jgi:NADH-quinone oxidoreductase subunit K
MDIHQINGNFVMNNMLPNSNIGITHFLALSALLFAISIMGIFLNRKNIIVVLMSIELHFRVFLHNIHGQIFVLFILTVAAAEAAIGLAILILLFKNIHSINVHDMNSLEG